MSRSTTAVGFTVVPEFAGGCLGDRRRAERLVAVARRLEAEPRAPFPKALPNGAELEGFYRFVNNPAVEPDQILAPHQQATVERAAESRSVVVVHDTTTFEFSGKRPRAGFGITTTSARYGFLGHFSLAVEYGEACTPLGVLRCETFTRTGTKWSKTKKSRTKVRDDPARESLRWWHGVAAVQKQAEGRFDAIHVMDAEADFYELLSTMHGEAVRFVVRSGQQQRMVREGGEVVPLRTVAEQMTPKTWRTVTLSARRYVKKAPRAQVKRHPAREGRTAKLAISGCKVRLRPTRYSAKSGGDVEVSLVRVWEPEPPGDSPAVEWLLLTTEPINGAAALKRVVDLYRARWTIEEYFKALKSGCALEQRQLDSYEALRTATVLFAPIAYRLLLLRSLERRRATAPPRIFFSDVELKLLRADDATQGLAPLRTLGDGMAYLARMGGHLKHNGAPGWQTLARGYERLVLLRAGWAAALAADEHRRSDES